VDLVDLPFPAFWQAAGLALVLPVLSWAAWTAPWRRLQLDASAHVWYASLFCLAGLWSLRASFPSGPSLHLLGVPLFVLVAGPRLALVGSALVLIAATALRGGSWGNYGLNVAVLAIAPTLVTTAALAAAERWLPPHLFVYLFAGAFFGAAFAMLGAGGAGLAVASMAGVLPANLSAELSSPLFASLALAEATVTGMVITLLVVYHPTWVATYEADRYLGRR
jgi:uncharacterized membrane protein